MSENLSAYPTRLVNQRRPTLKARELKLRDVVQCYDGSFGTAVVSKIDHESVTLVRPYTRSDDYSTGVIPQVAVLIGMETFTVPRESDATFDVWSRDDVK